MPVLRRAAMSEDSICFAQETATASIARVELPAALPGAAALAFVPGNHNLLLATNDARVLVIDPENPQVSSCTSRHIRCSSTASQPHYGRCAWPIAAVTIIECLTPVSVVVMQL